MRLVKRLGARSRSIVISSGTLLNLAELVSILLTDHVPLSMMSHFCNSVTAFGINWRAKMNKFKLMLYTTVLDLLDLYSDQI